MDNNKHNSNQLSPNQIIQNYLNPSSEPGSFRKFIFSVIIHLIICVLLFLIITRNTKSNLDISTLLKNENNEFIDDDIIMTEKYINEFRKLDKNNEGSSKNNFIDEETRKQVKSFLDDLKSFLDDLKSLNNYSYPQVSLENIFNSMFINRLTNYSYKGTWKFFPYNSSNKEDDEEFGKYYKKKPNITLVTNNEITSVVDLFYILSSKNNFKIGKAYNGTATFFFERKKQHLSLHMKNLEDKFIDNWISHISYAKPENLKKVIDLKRKKFYFKGEFISYIMKGQLYNSNTFTGYKQNQCPTLIEAEFPLDKSPPLYFLSPNSTEAHQIYTINPSNISLIFSSACGLRIKISAEKYDPIEDKLESKTLSQVKIFIRMNMAISILYSIVSTFISCYIKKHQYTVRTFSVICFTQNISWHSYLIISLINIGIHVNYYFPYLILLCLFPLINCIGFDLYLSYVYWSANKRILSSRDFSKLRFSFFIIFYVFLIVSFLMINSFFFDKTLILISAIFLWVPQIIHNIRNDNKYIYPLIYIIIVTAYRMIIPIYFRLVTNNFLDIKDDFNFVIIISGIIFTSIFILYLQAFLGPRFMLPKRFRKEKLNYYRTKAQLLREKPDALNDECVICLNPLFISEENNKSKDNNNISFEEKNSNFKKNNNSIDFMKKSNIFETSNKKKFKKIKKLNIYKYKVNPIIVRNSFKRKKKKKNESICCCVKIFLIIKLIFLKNFLFFYKYNQNLKNKKYMLIKCGHAFHTPCLEKWLEIKKECPSCRAAIDN